MHIERLDRAIDPGLNAVSWVSVNAAAYIADVQSTLHNFELLADRVTDIITYRILALLSEMSATPLVDLPVNEPWTIDYFVERTQVIRRLLFRLSIIVCQILVVGSSLVVIRSRTVVGDKKVCLFLLQKLDYIYGIFISLIHVHL